MGKGTFIATVALLIAIAGAIVAFAAYFKHRGCTLCEDFDDDMLDDDLSDLDYYATQVDSEDDQYFDADTDEDGSLQNPVSPQTLDEDLEA